MKTIRFRAALRSGKGKVRSNNEDAFYFNGKYAEIEDMDQDVEISDEFQDQPALFAICDGMGGYENGEIASYTAVSGMAKLQRTLAFGDFSSSITDWVEETNRMIIQKARDGGCTLALLYYKAGKIHIAHIGDSRIYRQHHGVLSRITKDHSKVQVLLDAGVLSEKQVESYPQRHVITRALGMNEEVNGRCMPSIQEPIFPENGDRYIICSDGVTDMLNDRQLSDIISHNDSSQNCAEAVFQAAMNAGGKDNTSVIVIDVMCETDMEPKNIQSVDPYETTLSPHQKVEKSIRIEQVTTIRQANGQSVIFRSEICCS